MTSRFKPGDRISVNSINDLPPRFHGAEGFVLDPKEYRSVTKGYVVVRLFSVPNPRNDDYWQIEEAHLVPLPFCPSCEKNYRQSGDYLCHECRWGV